MNKVKPKKCQVCKEKFTPIYSTIQPTCSIKCTIELNKRKKEKALNEKVKLMKIDTHSKEYRKELQDEVNKLSRKIDEIHGYILCIDDCGKGYGKQTDAAHFHSRGSNSSLRYNLHNLHSANSQCNQFSDKHHEGYKIGLEKRYGIDYLNKVLNLPNIYKEIKLSNKEVYEKLKVVRLLIRTVHTFQFESSIEAREYFNKIIGIYQ
ncbi:Bacteriophage lambda NinG [uncultured Caudovirales phage]|uniref:Protein ninG n=1 Tax=uncultured Caudovirales phage TaxID=2100421 RepID=A0A6J5KX82_9CAUD|nr:Bacteriophage lambda NinG [uncultured Caudovirales phage]